MASCKLVASCNRYLHNGSYGLPESNLSLGKGYCRSPPKAILSKGGGVFKASECDMRIFVLNQGGGGGI